MGKFAPEEEFAEGSPALIVEVVGEAGLTGSDVSPPAWSPFFRQSCTFSPTLFKDVMWNLVKNPNINSSWLFRADILYDGEGPSHDIPEALRHIPVIPAFQGCECTRLVVRKLIPRNAQRDLPLDQTCIFYESAAGQEVEKTLVVYIPHASAADELPFYHPRVRGIALLHEWSPARAQGHVSVSFLLFDKVDRSEVKLTRTALQLLMVLHKHGQGRVAGYVKRVHHDTLVAQRPFQDRYAELKQKYARALIAGWAEATDPVKHVFEDLGIAAFLIELWTQMYQDRPFPGFVDIGCGNGLLVYLLNQEGYEGWGFDARTRKSWANYNTKSKSGKASEDTLRQLVLLPSIVEGQRQDFDEHLVHDGRFPQGTFIISNHADELTPWTPIVATLSDCPFIAIPCCSHGLSGAKYRAPPPKDKSKGASAYASLVEWTSGIAQDCGWDVETEMLRIPSTRNAALVGRTRLASPSSDINVHEVVQKYGGAVGYFDSVVKLVKTAKEH
ncbi:DUF1613-domain-containing protein [Thozetella sp. PMI_491]|nr:DUF1613-domain-containing protein [Thozetella sp. PMI_491]